MRLGDSHRPLRDHVLDELRNQILDGHLAPGATLNESAIAQDLGVSRLPVREAIRRLESLGLVTSVPRKGAKVSEIGISEKETVHEIRTALELLAVRQTMQRRDASIINELQIMIQSGAKAELDGDVATLKQLNGAFHDLLARGSGSPILETMLATIRHQSEYLSGGKHAPMEISWDEHAEIMQAVVDGRTREATSLMRRHLSERHATSMALTK